MPDPSIPSYAGGDAGGVDNTPIAVGAIVIVAAVLLVALKRAGFRAVIGVSAGGK